MPATLRRKSPVTISPRVRKPWTKITSSATSDEAAIPGKPTIPAFDEKRARAVLGSMKKELAGRTVAEWMTWLRGPVELPPHAPRRR